MHTSCDFPHKAFPITGKHLITCREESFLFLTIIRLEDLEVMLAKD